MAEPAPIYDPDKEEPVTRPDLQVLEGGGETSAPTDDLSAAAEPADLAKKEEAVDLDRVGRGYKPDNPQELTKLKPSAKGVLSFARANRGKIIIGGAATGFITLLIVGFLILIPFKIWHIVNNLQSRFFTTSENAIQKETDVLFSDYVRKHVLPGLNTCTGSTIDKGCTPKAIQGDSIVSKLYQGWRTAGLENKMAEKYGLEFKKVNTHFYMKTPGMTGDGADLGGEDTDFMASDKTLDDIIDTSNDSQFQKVGRTQLRQAYRDALQKETKWKRVMYRYKVGGLLAKKYGLKRCIIACNTRDNFNDWKDHKTQAAKMIIVERVLAPRSETLAIVIGCVIDGRCEPNIRSETDSNGRKLSKTQLQLQEELASLAAKNTGKYADVLRHSNLILKDGYKKYLVKTVARKIAGGSNSSIDNLATEKVAGSLVPIVGWANTASNTVYALERAGPKIKALSYATNAVAMVSMYTTYRVFADECKTGNCDPAILGSLTEALGPGDKTTLGGTASAEQAPLYANLIEGKNAQDSQSSTYKCGSDNDKSVPEGQLVCQEEVLGGNTSAVTAAINGVLGGLGPIKGLADFWHGTVGKLIEPLLKVGARIGEAVSGIPGYDGLVENISKAAQPIISFFTEWAFPSPFSDNMGGGRAFHMMVGGADVAGNDYAQNGLGGKALSPQQVAMILNEQTQQDIQNFKNQPFLTRIFDTNNKYSLVSRTATAMPSNWSSARQFIASIFSNPFGKIGHSFALLLSPNHAFAAATAQADPFGIAQYGYPSDDPDLAAANADPEKYWTENCSSDGTTLDWQDPKKVNFRWQDTAVVDDTNGQYKNTSTNPCLLIQAAVGSAGALYDSGLLTPEDNAMSNAASTYSTPAAADGSCGLNSPLYKSQYSQSQLAQIFGSPGSASSHPQMDDNLVMIDFLGHSVQVNKLIASCLTAVAQDIASSNIDYVINDMSCYRFDSDNGTSNIGLRSYHTYGAACDINHATNPFIESGASAPYDIPQAYVDIFNKHGFTWGGTWGKPKDYMHFEWHGVLPE